MVKKNKKLISIIIRGKNEAKWLKILLRELKKQTIQNFEIIFCDNNSEDNSLDILKKYKVELIGASLKAIKKAEDRELFKSAMQKIGLITPKGILAENKKEFISQNDVANHDKRLRGWDHQVFFYELHQSLLEQGSKLPYRLC